MSRSFLLLVASHYQTEIIESNRPGPDFFERAKYKVKPKGGGVSLVGCCWD